MYETAIPMGKMLNAFLAIHGRCKFIIFLRGQTPSLSAPTLILSLMEHFQGKAKNTVKHSIKSTFSISIQLNCNWLPGNPQLPPYIYIHVYHMYVYRDYACIKCDVGLRMATCCTSQKKTRVMSRKVLNMLQCNLCEITIRNIQ